MPYSIVPQIDHPKPYHPRITKTWVGWDVEENWNGVRLRRDIALVWHPTITLDDPRAIVIADDGLDFINASNRAKIQHIHPGRSFNQTTRLKDIIGNLLTVQVPNGAPTLLPHRAGRFEILCGPGKLGENRLWVQETDPDKNHSQNITDSFNRADGNISGSTSSDGLFTWSLAQGASAQAQIVSNQAKFTRSGTDLFSVMLPSVAMDTINHSAKADIVSRTESGSCFMTGEVGVRIRYGTGAAGEEGYGFAVGKSAVPVYYRAIYDFAVGGDLPGATSSATAAVSGITIYLEFNGSTYIAKVDGSTLFTGTDTLYSTYKNATFMAYVSADNNSINIIMDNYFGADLVTKFPFGALFGG